MIAAEWRSIAHFAKVIGCDRTTVSSWVNGRRRHIDDDTANRILDVLGDTRDILFTAETSPVSSPKVPDEEAVA